MAERYVVVGGGMTGIVASLLLRQAGNEVTLLENRPELGGVNSGLIWDGYSLDFGCHLFGNDSDTSTRVLLELMEGEVIPVHVRFASKLNGQLTEGFELPNLESLGEVTRDRILLELLEACAKPEVPAATLHDWLTSRYGPTAASALGACLRKVFPVGATELAPEAAYATTFRRIRLVSDEVARVLKQLPVLDDRLAQGSAADPMSFYRQRVSLYPYRSFYPKSGGMRGFATRARRVLERAGVSIHAGVCIRALSLGKRPQLVSEAHGEFSPDRIVWTLGTGRLEPWLGGTRNIAAASVSVPMVLFYFAIDKSQETGMSYVNDFDESGLIFRACVPGAYGRENCPEGKSYVCCEVPAPTDGAIWLDPEQFAERIWEEALELGVAVGRPLKTRCQRARESYKAPRVDFWERSAELSQLAEREPALIVSPEWKFSTNRTIVELIEQIRQPRAA